MAGNKENVEPNPSKKRRISLSLKGKSKDSRFTSVSEEELTVMAKKQKYNLIVEVLTTDREYMKHQRIIYFLR